MTQSSPAATVPETPRAHAPRLTQRTVVGVTFVVGMFLNIMDTTIVNVALPSLGREFARPMPEVEWTVLGYLLSLAVWIPASGWIGDRFGTKRAFLAALALFTAASALCGASISLPMLVACRLLQGVGGGMLAPIGTAMLFRAYPPQERAKASRVLILPTIVAPALGPILGGWFVEHASWRWVFFVNLPIGLAALAFGAVFLEEHRETRPGRFDAAGFALSALGFASLLFALSEGPVLRWSAPPVVLALVVGVAALALLVRVELRLEQPMLDLRLLGARLFATTNLVSAFGIAGFLGTLFLMPLFMQEGLGRDALTSGLTTFPEALGVLCAAQIAGRIYGRVGPRRLIASGLACAGTFIALVAWLAPTADLWTLRALMFGIGASMGFLFVPQQAAMFAQTPKPKMGRASAIFNTQRQVAAAFGVALLATVLAAQHPGGLFGAHALAVADFPPAFLTAAVLSWIGAAIAVTIRDTDAAASMTAK